LATKTPVLATYGVIMVMQLTVWLFDLILYFKFN